MDLVAVVLIYLNVVAGRRHLPESGSEFINEVMQASRQSIERFLRCCCSSFIFCLESGAQVWVKAENVGGYRVGHCEKLVDECGAKLN